MAIDPLDPKAWRDALSGAAALVHLSSRTGLRAAEEDAAGDYQLNVRPVQAIVDASEGGAIALPIVFTSTATIFGDRPSLPVGETAPDNPLSVYDRHKLACEKILAGATQAGLVSVRSLRLSNVYGATKDGQFFSSNSGRGILNAMMLRALKGEPLTLFGSGQYLRDFIHLEDVVDAIHAAVVLKNPENSGGAFVVSSGQGYTLKEVFGLVCDEAGKLTGQRTELRLVPEPDDLHPSERRNFTGNSSLFTNRTGWRPLVQLVDGIREFLDKARRYS